MLEVVLAEVFEAVTVTCVALDLSHRRNVALQHSHVVIRVLRPLHSRYLRRFFCLFHVRNLAARRLDFTNNLTFRHGLFDENGFRFGVVAPVARQEIVRRVVLSHIRHLLANLVGFLLSLHRFLARIRLPAT